VALEKTDARRMCADTWARSGSMAAAHGTLQSRPGSLDANGNPCIVPGKVGA
jgi:hypothetical protein